MLELNQKVKVLGTGAFGGREGTVTRTTRNKDGNIYFGLTLPGSKDETMLFWFKERELLPIGGTDGLFR